MDNERKYLPYSGNRYYINNFGYIFNSNDNSEIKCYLKNDKYFIDLEWVLGKRPYLVGLVVLVTFNKLTIPPALYDEVEPLFQDNDKSNFLPVNLIYRFKNGPLPVYNYPGYFYIPFFNEYGINKNGDLKNIITGKNKIWSINKNELLNNRKGGYFYSRVVNSAGFSTIIYKHRVLCLVFKEYNSDIFSIVTNHKDGNTANNDLDNLELVSYKENTNHAYATGLQVGASKEVLVKNLKTNEIKKFISLRDCFRSLKLHNYQYVAKRIRHNNRFYKDYLCFKYDDDTIWPSIDIDDKSNLYREQIDREVIARNVFTGDLYIFSGSKECERDTGVKQSEINRSIRDSQVIPINGYNFQYLDDLVEWPVHSSRHLQIYKKYPFHPRSGLIALDTDTKEELFFTRISEALEHFKITKPAFYHYLYENRKFNDKYLFSLFKLPENQGHPTE